jgi:hypothetical protein
MVEGVRLRLTDYAGQWDQSQDAFARMAAALRTSLGEPTDRKPGTDAEIHWAGADTTLVLDRTGGSVYLELVTNKRLSLDEELRQMDEEGLLWWAGTSSVKGSPSSWPRWPQARC